MPSGSTTDSRDRAGASERHRTSASTSGRHGQNRNHRPRQSCGAGWSGRAGVVPAGDGVPGFGSLLDFQTRITGIAQPARPVLLQAAREQRADCRRRRRRQRLPVGIAGERHGDRIRCRGAVEGSPSGQHFVEHAPERPHVRPFVDLFPADLLGAHVGRRPDHRALARRQRRVIRLARGGLGNAEVEHLDMAVARDLDIGRLEVAMHDPLVVRRRERAGDLGRDSSRIRQRQPAPSQSRGERLAVDQLEYQGADAVVLLEAVDRADVRMIERGEDARFATEARQSFGVLRQKRRQDLDGNVALQPGVARAIHLAHAAGPDVRINAVWSQLPADQVGHYRRRFEKRPGGCLLRQQRRDLLSQFAVGAAGTVQEGVALRRRTPQCLVNDRFDSGPAARHLSGRRLDAKAGAPCRSSARAAATASRSSSRASQYRTRCPTPRRSPRW